MATGTAGTTARKSSIQMVHYLRMAINWNDTGISSGVGKQYLPAGAIIVGTTFSSRPRSTRPRPTFSPSAPIRRPTTTSSPRLTWTRPQRPHPERQADRHRARPALGRRSGVREVRPDRHRGDRRQAAYVIIKYVVDNDL
jgi:hypothetical protein